MTGAPRSPVLGYSSSRAGVSGGPEIKTLLSSGYQIGGSIHSVAGEIYVDWNQLVMGQLQDYGLDRSQPHIC